VDTVDARTNNLVASLEDIRRTPLDMISVSRAGDVVRDVFDRHSDELPVGVARFGSAI
jgi:hypothetical protein